VNMGTDPGNPALELTDSRFPRHLWPLRTEAVRIRLGITGETVAMAGLRAGALQFARDG
jgi:hypothetical protein